MAGKKKKIFKVKVTETACNRFLFVARRVSSLVLAAGKKHLISGVVNLHESSGTRSRFATPAYYEWREFGKNELGSWARWQQDPL